MKKLSIVALFFVSVFFSNVVSAGKGYMQCSACTECSCKESICGCGKCQDCTKKKGYKNKEAKKACKNAEDKKSCIKAFKENQNNQNNN